MAQNSPHETALSEWMDFIRWIAAFTVAISHIGGPLLVSLSSQPKEIRPLLQYGYSFVAGFAHPAVIVFFVMSGFFVGGLYSKSVVRRGPSPGDYLIKRLVRLWIVLIPTIAASYLLNTLGSEMATQVYADRKSNHLDLATAACNATFLQTTYCGLFASNDSLWSIFHEFWYYIIFLLGITAFYSNSKFMRISLGLLAATLLTWLSLIQTSNAPIAPYFLIWLLGVYVAWAPPIKTLSSPHLNLALFGAVLIIIRITLGPDRMHGTTIASYAADAIIGLSFTRAMISLRDTQNIIHPPFRRINAKLADFSYSLYCIHLPLALFYSSTIYKMTGLGYEMIPDSGLKWAIVLGCIIFVVIGSYLFYLVFERNTQVVRNLATQIIKKSPSQGTP